MSMIDIVAIGVKTLRIDSWGSLEKEFTKLIYMNPLMVLYLIVNQFDSCHSYIFLSFDLRHQRHLIDG